MLRPRSVPGPGRGIVLVLTLVPRAAPRSGLHAERRNFPAAYARRHERTRPDCIFCKIVAGDIPADVVHETEHSLAFRDLEPQAPTHVLVIPRAHYPNAAELAAGDPDAAVDLVAAAGAVADAGGPGRGVPDGLQHRRRRTRPSSTRTCTCSAAGR